jgi:outer membrane murein-binding lipoprotein Lpp
VPYVLVFLLGAGVAAGVLLIGYFSYIALLTRREFALQAGQNQLRDDSAGLDARADALNRDIAQRTEALNAALRGHEQAVAVFEARKVQYGDLVNENNLLKRDVFNLGVQLKKTERDHAAITERQAEIDSRANQLAGRYLNETVSVIGDKITPNNFASSKTRLLKAIENVRGIGFAVSDDEENRFVQDLKSQFEAAVRKEFQRQEQTRIKAQIREEERLARDVEKKVQEAQREQAVIEAALEKAIKEAKDEHGAEVERLRAELKEAQEKAQRAISQAQLTKAGYVYVLSNLGSFGDGVYKIGMTRRLEPMDRVRELGDASVPFPFDVHMMIACDDAPSLENSLHRSFHRQRLNKVNPRKEYFRVGLNSIVQIAEKYRGEVEYVADPGALEYRESLTMTDEDADYLESVIDSLTDGPDALAGED